MADVSFVRTEMLAQQAPPASEVGLIGWVRQNLFSGWLNSLITIVSLLFIYYVVSRVLHWAATPTWGAGVAE